MSLQTLMAEKSTNSRALPIHQPATTYTGAVISPLRKGLPRATESLCPECSAVISAIIHEDDGRVVMEKVCADHGAFRDVLSSDVRLYLKMEEWSFGDERGVSNPVVTIATRCPEDCGLCPSHTSHTGLANLDLTNRCNLTCPVCFANANTSGYVYEPSLDQVRSMLQSLRDEKPVAGRIVQFSGGEPTVYPYFIEAVRTARQLGFSHIQVATNGLRFTDEEFTHQCAAAGLHTLYLQFDGVTDDVYLHTRGRRLLADKLKVIENVRKSGMKICFVPTIVRGVNDHQIGDILRIALQNIDVVSAISYQPVAFAGRIARHELESKRFNLSDLAHAVQDQTGICDSQEDWFPLACVTPFSRLLSAIRGEPTTHLSCNPHCAMGTYLFVPKSGPAVPVTRFVEIGPMLAEIDAVSRSMGKQRFKLFSKIRVWNSLRQYFREERAPQGLTFGKFLRTLQGLTDKQYGRGRAEKEEFSFKTLMVAGMHFMDHHNYDIERVKRCVIHYAAPNGRIYPFCAYNSGPTFRTQIEKQFSTPLG